MGLLGKKRSRHTFHTPSRLFCFCNVRSCSALVFFVGRFLSCRPECALFPKHFFFISRDKGQVLRLLSRVNYMIISYERAPTDCICVGKVINSSSRHVIEVRIFSSSREPGTCAGRESQPAVGDSESISSCARLGTSLRRPPQDPNAISHQDVHTYF